MTHSTQTQNGPDQQLRDQLVKTIGGREAHIDFEAALADVPVDGRGTRLPNAPHSPWELLEHMRIAQHDILQFSVDATYRSPAWPDGYWPQSPEPPDSSAWERAVQAFLADRKTLEELIQNPESNLYQPLAHGNGQTLLREALLVASHNSYHLGQLVYALRQLQAQ